MAKSLTLGRMWAHGQVTKTVLLLLLTLTLFINIFSFTTTVKAISGATAYRGLSWYGLDLGNFDAWKLNEVGFNQAHERYPNMNVLVLPFSSRSYYYSDRLRRLDDFIRWCGSAGIKVVISNYEETYSKGRFITFWRNMAARYKGNNVVLGFDLVNEPWGMSGSRWVENWSGLVDDYEEMIDAIRTIDPNRKCFVQSYQRNWKGFDWIRTNPVKRPNIAYITHIYSHDWKTGAWLASSYVYPWIPYYKKGDYAKGRTALRNELWKDIGRVISDTGVKFFVSETATNNDANSKRYYLDLIEILEEWGCDWAYHSYYSREYSSLTLTYQSGSEKGNAATVKTAMRAPEISFLIPTEDRFLIPTEDRFSIPTEDSIAHALERL